ncbi:MAG: alpha/beta fold hydrolase BchO [Pseudomonadota bacterium]
MNWAEEKADWPNADLSRFVETRGHRWHVQRGGAGPKVLLIHGAGGATHSWRDMLPMLAEGADVLAVDLPGHGFTTTNGSARSSLPAMAEDLRSLLDAEDFVPRLTVGHSAGAAIALQMARGRAMGDILALNAALRPFEGVAGAVFPPLAKLLSLNPFTARFFAWSASGSSSVRNLIEGTGSRLDARGLALYQKVVSDPRHVDGALKMMARWDLAPLLRALPEIDATVTFAIGLEDRTVPPAGTRAEAARMSKVRVEEYPGFGHLMHEEHPRIFVDLARESLDG